MLGLVLFLEAHFPGGTGTEWAVKLHRRLRLKISATGCSLSVDLTARKLLPG